MRTPGNFLLEHDGRVVELRATRRDYAALEALRLLGAKLVCNRRNQPSIGPEITLTVFVLDRKINLTRKRLADFQRLPRPVTVDYLRHLRMPDRLQGLEERLCDRTLPFLVFLAKLLNVDDGTLRPYDDWMRDRADLERTILAAPPEHAATASL